MKYRVVVVSPELTPYKGTITVRITVRPLLPASVKPVGTLVIDVKFQDPNRNTIALLKNQQLNKGILFQSV